MSGDLDVDAAPDDEYNPNLVDADDRDSDDGDSDDGDSDDVFAPTAQSVLTYLVKAVVDDPDAVDIEVDDAGRRTALNVTVGDGDMGRVIGKRGRVAQSIRTVTRAAAARDGVEIDIEFLD